MFTEVEKEPCRQKEKTGKWLDPAYVKKKRKTFDIKLEKDRKETNSKNKPKLKLRSMRRLLTKAKTKTKDNNQSLKSLKNYFTYDNNLQYFIS